MFVLWSNSCVTVGDTCDGIENFTGISKIENAFWPQHFDNV